MSEGDRRTRHVVIDMQRLFAEDTAWHTPAITEILPNVLTLCNAFEGRTLFAKFMLPHTPDHAAGRWRDYYRRWSMLTTAEFDPAFQDLMAPLAARARPEDVLEKPTYSVFQIPGLAERLRGEGVEKLVFSGVETDICVLASVFDAIDAGFHAVVISDAVGSSAPAAHRATLDHVLSRMPDQIDIIPTAWAVAAGGYAA